MSDKETADNVIDVDSIVWKINRNDSSLSGMPDYPNTGVASVDEALWRLRTIQMIHDTKEKTEKLSRINDAFSNPAAKTGWGEDNLINATEYPMTRLTQNWQLLTSLYRTSWIIQRVCNVIPEDALADLFIEAPGLDTEEVHKIEEEIRSTHLRESLLEGLRWGRLYGGAAAIIMVSGQEEDLSEPIDIDNVMPGAFRGLYIVDRWSGIYPSLQLVDNERDPDFGLPEYYEVRDENGVGQYHVHHSRVLRFCGSKMPFWEEVAEQYWGTSAVESIYDELTKHDNVAHNIANLTFKANLNVMKVENLDQMFATSSTIHQRRMYQMLSAINTIENSLGIRLINSTDDIQQLQYSFSGLPEVMDTAMMDMAGATGIPVTRLFGRSPAGMNSTGEADERMYRQTLEQERAIHITPALERLLPIVCHSAIGKFPGGASFKYPSLIETTPQDKAQVIDQQLAPLERLFQANLIPGEVVLEAFRNSQEALDVTSTITDEHINKVRGKYLNDLQQMNADPYGGAMQSAVAMEPAQEPHEPQQEAFENPVVENAPVEHEITENEGEMQEMEEEPKEVSDSLEDESLSSKILSEYDDARYPDVKHGPKSDDEELVRRRNVKQIRNNRRRV